MAIDDPWQLNLEQSTLSSPGDSIHVEQSLVPGLTLVSHPNRGCVGAQVRLSSLASGRRVELSRSPPLFSQPGSRELFPIADPHLSRQPILLAQGRDPGSVILRRHQWPSSLEINGEPVESERLLSAGAIAQGVVLLLSNRVCLLLHLMHPAPQRDLQRHTLIGESHVMQDLRQKIKRVSNLSVSVLLRGETGTGKELVAQAIHLNSPRRSHPYLPVNMAAIPTNLAAAELFGAAQGAFTGADRRRKGYFQRAHGGTLFLDEIAETPGEIQALLLRALENGEVQPVGSELPQQLDVRLIAATDGDLEAESQAGRFRAPLLHRLKGFEIQVPPLRQRRDDVGRLLIHFLEQELKELGHTDLLEDPGPKGRLWLTPALVARLAAHDWPGNVRELRNVARHLAINSHAESEARLEPEFERSLVATGTSLGHQTGSFGVGASLQEHETPALPDPPGQSRAQPKRRVYLSPNDIDDAELIQALRANRWRLLPTANQLGVSRTSLYKLIDACPQIRRASDLSREYILETLDLAKGHLDTAAERLEVSRQGLLLRIRELEIEGY